MRLWVDNELLIDQWRDQAPATFSASKYLGPGHHLVRVEYYEDFGGAVARVSWTQGTPPPPPPPQAVMMDVVNRINSTTRYFLIDIPPGLLKAISDQLSALR